MKIIAIFLAITFGLVQGAIEYPIAAKAVLTLNSEPKNVTGTVYFQQYKLYGAVAITVNIYGLTPHSKHGFHVHELGYIYPDCSSAKGHFNPHKVNHGAKNDAIRHVGDLGNVQADENGNIILEMNDTLISLTGLDSIIGRSVVVHVGEDDLGKTDHPDSKTTGNAGARWACGIIGYAR